MSDIVDGLTIPTSLYIGGTWRSSSDSSTFPVVDPATGETITEVANGTAEDALACVDAAELAAPVWAATSPRERSTILLRAFSLMIEKKQQLAELIVRENGKAMADALGEVQYSAEFFRWYAEEAVRIPGEITDSPSGQNKILVLRQPMGIALLITPWNFPAAMATRKIGPALAAGCTAILKPASETPLTALAIGQILEDAGVPPGVVNILPSRASGTVANAILHDPRVRKLSFTGSTEVGRTLLAVAADQVISCSMELGGNAPLVVCADADLEVAVEGAMVAKMRNGGQACTAANRIYVHRSIADEFSRRLAERMAGLNVGSGLDTAVDVGPLVNLESVAKVEQLVDDAVQRGATTVTGGARPDSPGYFYQPTVLTDVDPQSQILEEEIFGPIAPVVAFDTDDEAIEMANGTIYGLVAYVFTQDLARGLRISERLEAGMIGLNRGLISDAAAPFGGVKQSGLGREGSHEGLLEYTEPKYIALDWSE
ncbi:NAD-dependent succinate-semialdehyde dehydrogenase [Georgenia sp. H159]|uniref:NAD-dependent succinate-semialdehyde dehydrogenase n=1 Tax=Georgenia sp. H159 TaxID=3076115 RepID=UPI002D788131|nr:NAD-dependent succinate-semialdehyde dehydrogenase [Georgenia sp. H159]